MDGKGQEVIYLLNKQTSEVSHKENNICYHFKCNLIIVMTMFLLPAQFPILILNSLKNLKYFRKKQFQLVELSGRHLQLEIHFVITKYLK